MPGDTAASSHNNTRKRGNPGESRDPADSKKPSRRTAAHFTRLISGNFRLKEVFRAEIAGIYANYRTLVESEGSSSSTTTDVAAFQSLLEAGQGSCAAKRLAARLAPRFLPRFPCQLESTASLLMGLYQEQAMSDQDVDTIVDAKNLDALLGLGYALEAAMKLADKAVPTVLRVTDFLLRQLHAHSISAQGLPTVTTSCAAPVDTPPSENPATQLASLHSCKEDVNHCVVVQQLLEKACRCFPRVVLSCCLQSFRGDDMPLYRAALIFLERQLLAEPEPRPAAATQLPDELPGAAARNASLEEQQQPSSRADTAALSPERQQQQQTSACEAPPAASAGLPPAAARSQCLAAEVLSQLPETQTWLRQAIVVISKDKRILSAKELHPHMDKLLKLIAPQQQQQQQQQEEQQEQQSAVLQDERGSTGQAAARHLENGGEVVSAVAAAATKPTFAATAAAQLRQQSASPSLLPPGFSTPSPGLQPAAVHPPLPAAAAAAAAALSRQQSPVPVLGGGGSICCAAASLFISGLPPAVTEAMLRTECSTGSAVSAVYMAGTLPALGLSQGQALVTFDTVIPDAALCYEALNGGSRFGGSTPLHVEFCASLPAAAYSSANQARGRQQGSPGLSGHVWVARHSLEAVLGALTQAGLPSPRQAIEVGGHVPGLMLDYSVDGVHVQAVVDCLAAALLPPNLQQQQQQQQQAPMAAASCQLGLPAAAAAAAAAAGTSVARVSPAPGTAAAARAGTPPLYPSQQQQQQQGPEPGLLMTSHPHVQHRQQLPPSFLHLHNGGRLSPGLLPQLPAGFAMPLPHHLPHVSSMAPNLGHAQLGMAHNPAHMMMQQQQQQQQMFAMMQHQQQSQMFAVMQQQQVQQQQQQMFSMMRQQQQSPVPAFIHTPPHLHSPVITSTQHPQPQQHNLPNHLGGLGSAHQQQQEPWLPHLAGSGPSQQQQQEPWLPHLAGSGPSQQQQQEPWLPHLAGSGPSQQQQQQQPLLPHLGSSGSSQQQQQQQQQIPQAPGEADLPIWQGALAKSGAPLCTLACHGNAAAADGVHSLVGPDPSFCWPDVLDVRLRVETRYVEQLYCSTDPDSRSLSWLSLPAGFEDEEEGSHASKLSEFVQYLASKGRAGVVQLGAHSALPCPEATMYLVPPSDQVCAALGADWPPLVAALQAAHDSSMLLLAVTTPTPAS